MSLLPDEYSRALRNLVDTSDNPFFWREKRRDARRSDPWRLLLVSTLGISTAFLLALLAVWGLMILLSGQASLVLGDTAAKVVFSVTAAVHAALVSSSARSRVDGVLAREARGGTLRQVFLTRMTAFEIVANLVVYPLQAASLVALAGLPVYALMASIGTVSIHELLVLYLFLLWLATAAPRWRTPAFGEQTPEEMSVAFLSQLRADGCTAVALRTILVPATMLVGFLGWLISTYNRTTMPVGSTSLWRAVAVLPVTYMWLLVRTVSTPYLWFGIPLYPWLWLIPLLFAGRVSALWISSGFLRVGHRLHLNNLPDARPLGRWLRIISTLWTSAVLGYLWTPITSISPILAAIVYGLWAVTLLRRTLAGRAGSGGRAERRAGSIPPVTQRTGPVVAPASVQGRSPSAPARPLPAAWVPPPPDLSWRSRKLSTMGAAALRRISVSTDNPIALLSVRRALPGSLGIDWLILGGGALVSGLFLAAVAPELMYLIPGAALVSHLLYARGLDGMDRTAWGMSLVVSALLLLTFLRSTTLTSAVASGYRRERERATLGFVLASPMRSRDIALGYVAGPMIAPILLWGACAISALLPTLILVRPAGAGVAFGGWFFGFVFALMYVGFCAACGSLFGVRASRARDVRLSVCVPAGLTLATATGLGLLAAYRKLPYHVAMAGFGLIMAAYCVGAWSQVSGALRRARRGDLPFEGRSD